MDDLGKYLQGKREDIHLSIDTLSTRTRIPTRFIIAIEANRFEQLPNPVSAKGFLRSYAETVNADTSAVLAAFSKLHPASTPLPHTERQDEILSYLRVERHTRPPFPKRVAISVGGVIILLIALAVLLPKQEAPPPITTFPLDTLERSEPPVPPDMPAAEAGAIVTDAPSPESPLPAVETPDPTNPLDPAQGLEMKAIRPDGAGPTPVDEAGAAPTPSDASPPGVSVLLIEALEPSWVQVVIDDRETREALLQPNDTVRWEAADTFLLTLGNAGGVRVLLDGEELGPFGPSGEVVHKEIRVAEGGVAQNE